ncbi:MAG: 16S rRNA (cytosine(1402)-N(4))-methyltransferase RsmH [Candidatus Omnitrophota bacterium]
MEESFLHKSVLLRESIDLLNLSPGKTVIDATVGAAGHSEEILRIIHPKGRLIGIDRDKEALEIARNRLAEYKGSFELIKEDFRNLKEVVDRLKLGEVDGILFDLGISSLQMESEARGFSIKHNGPLDMRMDKDQRLNAEEIVNGFSELELGKIFKDLGEERFYRRIAKSIVYYRSKKRITETAQLADIVLRSMPFKNKRERIHPATRVFQAIRIKVNNELSSIETALRYTPHILKKGGRVSVISFHSLEDRIAKTIFKEFKSSGIFRNVVKKPITPGEEELKRNPRARSAKLRVAERIA